MLLQGEYNSAMRPEERTWRRSYLRAQSTPGGGPYCLVSHGRMFFPVTCLNTKSCVPMIQVSHRNGLKLQASLRLA